MQAKDAAGGDRPQGMSVVLFSTSRYEAKVISINLCIIVNKLVAYY